MKESRERILAAAARVLGTEGERALTTRRVAREAGVNQGLLHYYFASMDELRLEVLRDFVLRLGASAAIIDAEAEDPRESLVEALTQALGAALESPGLLLALIGLLLESARERAALVSGEGSHGGAATAPGGAATAPGGAVAAASAAGSPIGALIAVQRGLAARIERMTLRAIDPGSEAPPKERIELAARRALQLVASIFHPMILVDLPREVFGLDLRDEASRRAYISQAVETALAPLEYTRAP